MVYNMRHEDPGNVSYSSIGGLSEQIRELRESIELPLMNPELFQRVGIKPPKVKPEFHTYHTYQESLPTRCSCAHLVPQFLHSLPPSMWMNVWEARKLLRQGDNM